MKVHIACWVSECRWGGSFWDAGLIWLLPTVTTEFWPLKELQHVRGALGVLLRCTVSDLKLLQLQKTAPKTFPTILLDKQEEKSGLRERGRWKGAEESCWLHHLITEYVSVCACVRYSACYPACCGGQWGQRLWVVTSCPLAGEG